MAFTGTPVIKQVSERMYRITGVTLAFGAAGTIGLNLLPNGPAGPGEVDLFAPDWQPYDDVTLQDAVSVLINPTTDVNTAIPIRVVKTGTDHTNFLVTLTNDHDSLESPGLEIYVMYH
jgi:hypothetical protein